MIFCVEDDSNIRELVVYTLESTGFKARGFEEGKSFLEALALETPELILLDIMLPGMDGMELLRKLKGSAKTREIPVIMVTAKGAEYDKVMGLDAGADDYVTKPFNPLELTARVKSQLRRYTQLNPNSGAGPPGRQGSPGDRCHRTGMHRPAPLRPPHPGGTGHSRVRLQLHDRSCGYGPEHREAVLSDKQKRYLHIGGGSAFCVSPVLQRNMSPDRQMVPPPSKR